MGRTVGHSVTGLVVVLLLAAPLALAQTPAPKPTVPALRGGGVARPASAEASRYVSVIAHPDVPLDAIGKRRLLDYFTRDVRRWEGGTRIVLFDYAGPEGEREAFFDFLGRSASRMRSLWLRQRLAGEGDPPETFRDPAALVARVARTPGALAFVGASFATDSVKVLRLIPIEPDG